MLAQSLTSNNVMYARMQAQEKAKHTQFSKARSRTREMDLLLYVYYINICKANGSIAIL